MTCLMIIMNCMHPVSVNDRSSSYKILLAHFCYCLFLEPKKLCNTDTLSQTQLYFFKIILCDKMFNMPEQRWYTLSQFQSPFTQSFIRYNLNILENMNLV